MQFEGLPDIQFLFEYDEDWQTKALQDARVSALSAVIDDYRAQRRGIFMADQETQRQKQQLALISGCIHTLLSTEYNMESDRLYHTGAEVRDLFVKASGEMLQCFDSKEDVADAIRKMRQMRWQFVPTYEQRQKVLEQIMDVSVLSEEVRELLCDTYDNGYQMLNYFLQYVRALKQREEIDDQIDSSGGGMKRSYADEKYLEKVLELFGGDVKAAIECTAALDDARTFLWNIFETEDMMKVVDAGIIRRQISEKEADQC